MYAHLCAGADEQRTEVERGAALIGRDEALVQADDLLGHGAEELRRHFGHHDAAAGLLQAFGVVVDAEQANLAVRAAEGFLALEGLLTVVEAGGGHVDIEYFGGGYFYFAPFSVAISTAHVIVCGHVAEGQVGPVDRL